MFKRLKIKIDNYFKNYSPYIVELGIFEGPKLAKALFPKNNKKDFLEVKMKGYKHSIFLRNKSTDISNFHEIFFNIKFPLPNNLNPKFIIDAGANAGYASIYFLNKYPNANIIAIEPDLKNFNLLQKNCDRYINFKSLKSAIWINNNYVKIQNPNAGSTAFQIIESDNIDSDSFSAITIDAVLKGSSFEYIDILKIDIEGVEKTLFEKGNFNWLNKVHVLIIELHDRFNLGCAISFYSAIESLNFSQFSNGDNLVYINKDFKLK
tara:strand:+ start:2180 stop:2971 length:792 start_codon:yes stop_codon:yes gene_type:complete